MESGSSLVNKIRLFSSVTHDNKIYTIGGVNTWGNRSNLVEVYNKTTKTWSDLGSSLSIPRDYPVSAVANDASGNASIYVFGGADNFVVEGSDGSANIVEKYDISANTWSILPTRMPENHSKSFSGVVDNKIYIIGGWKETQPFMYGTVQDTSAVPVQGDMDEWTTVADISSALLLHSSVTDASKNFIYTIAGTDGSSGNDAETVFRYDMSNNTWSSMANVPYILGKCMSAIVDEKIYVLGGDISENLVIVYDISTNVWTPTTVNSGTFYPPNGAFIGAVNKKIYIIGGEQGTMTSNIPIGKYRWWCNESVGSPANSGTSNTSLPLSLINGASWTMQNSQTCIDFDGTNDILLTTAAPLISFYDGFSISFWVYLDSTPSSYDEFFRLGEGSSGTSSPYMYLYWYNSSYMRMELHNGNYSEYENLSYPPDNNAWTHIVLTFSYTTGYSSYTTVRYYKDGVQKDNGSMRGLRWRGYHDVYFDRIAFGGRPNYNYSINGKMRDIQIFESTLSQSQIDELYSDDVILPPTLNSIQIYDISNNRFDASLNTFPTNRSFGISETLGNKIYTIGGGLISTDGAREPINKVEIYDTSNNTWTTGSTLPTARHSMASAITHNRYIYTIGGEGNQNCLERYDTTIDAWESSSTSSAFLVPHLTNIPVNSKNIVAGSDASHNIYVMGNNSVTVHKHSNTKIPSNKPYDLSGIQYDQYSIFSTVKDGSGIFYLIGGAPFGKYLSSYNHKTNEWKSLALMNTGREGAGSAVINNKILYIRWRQ